MDYRHFCQRPHPRCRHRHRQVKNPPHQAPHIAAIVGVVVEEEVGAVILAGGSCNVGGLGRVCLMYSALEEVEESDRRWG